MQEFVTGLQRGGQRGFDLRRGRLQVEPVERVHVFEPLPAVVEAGVQRAIPVVLARVGRHPGDEILLRPAGIAAVAIHLVERRREQHRRVVPGGGYDGGFEHGVRVGADGDHGDFDALVFTELDEVGDEVAQGEHCKASLCKKRRRSPLRAIPITGAGQVQSESAADCHMPGDRT
ncbi:MAG: hypothetical protein M5R40_28220 [Anaerolineae bacterium]|nr:hypothetical protein [Anaerolineae bacterium]